MALDSQLTPGNRRSSLAIMSNLLEAAREQRRRELQTDGGVSMNKRELMRSANINHSQLTSYIDILDSKGFIIKTETDHGLDIEITERGEQLLSQTQTLADLLG